MDYKELFYLFSISFQISGSFLLAYMGFTKKVNNIAEEVVGFALKGKDIESAPLPQVAGKLLEIYLTRMGFILVFIGYILSIFGSNGFNNQIIQLIKITFISLITSLVSLFIAYTLVNKRKDKIEKECKKNLPNGALFLHEMD